MFPGSSRASVPKKNEVLAALESQIEAELVELMSRSSVKPKGARDNLYKPSGRAGSVSVSAMDFAITSCESALESSDFASGHFYLKTAENYCETMLRHFWQLSLSNQDIQAFESRLDGFERLIVKLEARYHNRLAKSSEADSGTHL
jgi:hypothetical protein